MLIAPRYSVIVRCCRASGPLIGSGPSPPLQSPPSRQTMTRHRTSGLLVRMLVISMAAASMTADLASQSQRARQGPQTPAPVPGPIIQPSSTFPLKQIGFVKASNATDGAQFGDAV